MSRAAVPALALRLHDLVCSNGPDCSDRENHARSTQRGPARAILYGGNDPAETLHDQVCVAQLHADHHPLTGIVCSSRARHIEKCRQWLVRATA